jgi:endoglucanase
MPGDSPTSIPPRGRLYLALAFLVLAGCATTHPPSEVEPDRVPSSAAPVKAVPASAKVRAEFAQLGPGINFGNMLDAPREGDWGSRVRDGYPAMVWQAGFRHVRLPVRWSAHARPDADAQIDPEFMARVDVVVDSLLAQGFTVILDMHHYRQLDGDRFDPGEASVDPRNVKPRFLSMWRQIAGHFAGRGDKLWFELYNEPHGEQTAASWNDLAARALDVVRASNPQRTIVIGPVKWNSARELSALALPPDSNLVATVHDYQPFRFTHQQASWAGGEVARLSGETCCNSDQREALTEPLTLAKRWADQNLIPVWLGEFGSYGGPPGHPNDTASRAEYTRLVREAADQRGIPWAYWELDSGFGAYDPKARQWREPLRQALLGP